MSKIMNTSIKLIFLPISINLTVFFISSPVHSDIELGNPDAPVTIVEYGSITCGKCVRFHREVLPSLREHYIKNGKVHFIYRNFPTSSEALRGAVALRCAEHELDYTMLDALYYSVGEWSQAQDIDTALTDIASKQGLDRETFRSCLSDPVQSQIINDEKEDAILEYDVIGTPTFVINDKVIRGFQLFFELELLIEEAMLKQ